MFWPISLREASRDKPNTCGIGRKKYCGETRNEANSEGRRAEAIANKNAVLRIKFLNGGGEGHSLKIFTTSDALQEGYRRRDGGRRLKTPFMRRLTIGCCPAGTASKGGKVMEMAER